MSEKDKHSPSPQTDKDGPPEKVPSPVRLPEEDGLGQTGREDSAPAAAGTAAEHGREREEGKTAGHPSAKREAEIKALRQERDELKDKFLRALAETENLRKRAEREKSEYFQYALAEVLQDMLTVVDSLERALEAQDRSDGKLFLEGVRMIHRQFLDILARQGVTPLKHVVGSRFDPEFHQALSSEAADDVQEAVVSEELQKGYRLHDRLLRPALVKVKVPRPAVVD